jgi:hypothetical protein
MGDNSMVEVSKEQVIADLEKKERDIQAICGANVLFELVWETFEGDPEALGNVDRVSGYAVKRAVQMVCNEIGGKVAIRSSLRVVKLTNVKEVSEESVIFRDGVLELHCAYAEGRTAATGHDAIHAALTKGSGAIESDAYARFMKSMDIGLEQWREGIGYDLDALAQTTAAERTMIERRLICHLADPGDWRDVEALVALGTPAAMEAVGKARRHQDHRICEHALRHFLAQGPADSALEDDVARAVRLGAIDLAEQCPAAPVKHALLDMALSAEATLRVNAAAMLFYICGQASEPFDWNQRPFFLRFAEDNPEEIKRAWNELRQRIGL